jgi:hypothetical protein
MAWTSTELICVYSAVVATGVAIWQCAFATRCIPSGAVARPLRQPLRLLRNRASTGGRFPTAADSLGSSVNVRFPLDCDRTSDIPSGPVCADSVAKRIWASERAILIQNSDAGRNVDSNVRSSGFCCFTHLVADRSEATFATVSARSGPDDRKRTSSRTIPRRRLCFRIGRSASGGSRLCRRLNRQPKAAQLDGFIDFRPPHAKCRSPPNANATRASAYGSAVRH